MSASFIASWSGSNMGRLPHPPHTYSQQIREVQRLTAVVDKDDRFADEEKRNVREYVRELTIILAQVQARM